MSNQIIAIRKQLEVAAPVERAFRVFTENMGSWWPKEHHIGASALKDCVIEPRAGGRWYELGDDGSQCTWGKVMAWDPPRRLMLAWQLNGEFQYDPELITEVEVTFTALGPRLTRVDFEHRHLERFGEIAVRMEKDMGTGWGQILGLYVATAASAEQAAAS